MAEQRRDKLGRRITPYDRVAVEKRKKEKYGADFHKRAGALGGSRRTRGYFGYLKDTDPQKFAEIQKAAQTKAAAANRKKAAERRRTNRAENNG